MHEGISSAHSLHTSRRVWPLRGEELTKGLPSELRKSRGNSGKKMKEERERGVIERERKSTPEFHVSTSRWEEEDRLLNSCLPMRRWIRREEESGWITLAIDKCKCVFPSLLGDGMLLDDPRMLCGDV